MVGCVRITASVRCSEQHSCNMQTAVVATGIAIVRGMGAQGWHAHVDVGAEAAPAREVRLLASETAFR